MPFIIVVLFGLLIGGTGFFNKHMDTDIVHRRLDHLLSAFSLTWCGLFIAIVYILVRETL